MTRWAKIISGSVVELDVSQAALRFALLRSHLAKFSLITYYNECIAKSNIFGTPQASAVEAYKQARRRVTGKGGAGGGTGNENESIIKQIAANETDHVPMANYFDRSGISAAAKQVRDRFNPKLASAKPIADMGMILGVGVYIVLPRGAVEVLNVRFPCR